MTKSLSIILLLIATAMLLVNRLGSDYITVLAILFIIVAVLPLITNKRKRS